MMPPSCRLSTALLACVLALPLSVRAQEHTPRPLHITLGVYSFKKPTEVAKDFFPATDELARLMTAECGMPVAVDLRIFKTYDECLDKFVAGAIDLVRVGPASYVLVKQRNPAVQLLVAELEQEPGKKRAEGIIAVRKDSPIQSLADLRGRTFAFGDENSTIGRYLSQAELLKAGVHADDLKGLKYLERHDKVFKAVEVGDFDAGAMHVSTFEELNGEKKPLRELAHFQNVGKPWVARANLDAQIVVALRKALLAMKAPQPLKALKIFGFTPTNDASFQIVRDGMKTAEEFGRPRTASKPDTTPSKPDKD
jgi:phosphonate transport system substrate-binding protein